MQRGNLKRQAGLADAAWAHQREQPTLRIAQQPGQRSQLSFPPDQGCGRGRQIRGRAGRGRHGPNRSGRRQTCPQPLNTQLAACDLKKCGALVERNLEAVGQPFRHLPGRSPLIALDLAQG